MPINWHFIRICFIIQHNHASWSRMRSSKRILQLTAGTEGHGGRGKRLRKVRGQVYPPRVRQQFYSYTLPPSTLALTQHEHMGSFISSRTNTSTTTQNKPHLILLQDNLLISMMVRLKAHSPTGDTGTVRHKSAPDSHSGRVSRCQWRSTLCPWFCYKPG